MPEGATFICLKKHSNKTGDGFCVLEMKFDPKCVCDREKKEITIYYIVWSNSPGLALRHLACFDYMVYPRDAQQKAISLSACGSIDREMSGCSCLPGSCS